MKRKDLGVDPLKYCITIASACNLVFRRNYLQPNSIAVFSDQQQKNHSYSCLQWLHFESLQRGVYIDHARNGGERKIGPYFVDGFAKEGNIIFAFQGCYWHGCPDCYDEDTVHPTYNITMGELYKRTEKMKKFFQDVCPKYSYGEMREHEWQMLKEKLPVEMKAKINMVPKNLKPLLPREAFFRGRTNRIKLFHKVEGDEQIKYVDFCSLYPYTNKYCSYPVGHPTILTVNLSHNMSEYYGLVHCTILPPRKLYHPVLPVKIHEKLMYRLCWKCVENKSKSRCMHSEMERTITGTWVILEVQKAVQMGYTILKVEVVWHFEERAEYDRLTKSGGLFTKYIDTFLKIKQEASGWPSWCETEQDREKYVEKYYENEGVALDPQNVEYFPGLRALAKLMLNSFWGKFGQRSDLEKKEIVTKVERLNDLLKDCDKTELTNIRFINEEVLEVN
ncbi:hypothetical protein HOLleu_42943 [Holothuria leucospilota]|uniref:DNA-directed DNA polymerase n=1 Tax=Holothuria leucospilota TaxID=206669 RepID=A0A9Q1B970_HOLLE|nr:hypothetical protein HOLleu_42943 [Holothuria leucospilota]